MEKWINKFTQRLSFLFILLLTTSACTPSKPVPENKIPSGKVMTNSNIMTDTHYQESVVLAINIGGPEYLGNDGVRYIKDDLPSNAQKGQSSSVKGSQDPTLYKSYRVGDIALALPIKNGLYDVTFKFAEPDDLPVGGRLINVQAQNKPIINNLDIRMARDGMALSALDKTVANIVVSDGTLNLNLNAAKGQAVLHALIVRRKLNDEDQWRLVWQDEFDYSGKPNPDKWSHDVWPAGKVNDEDQTYTAREKNVRVENGHLVIEAHKEAFANGQYTSGRIHSLGKGDFLYGKAEVKARIPAGQGTWSAIWMLPSDPYKYSTSCAPGEDWQGSETCDAWPNSGEIDIMEYVGFDPNTIHGTVHNKAYYWMNWEQRKASIEVDQQVNEAFQIYAVEWGPDYLAISMNGTPYFYYANQGEGWRAWPFDHPYHLILNLAIGGQWGRAGGPIDDSLFPVRMEVDYVRIYERK